MTLLHRSSQRWLACSYRTIVKQIRISPHRSARARSVVATVLRFSSTASWASTRSLLAHLLINCTGGWQCAGYQLSTPPCLRERGSPGVEARITNIWTSQCSVAPLRALHSRPTTIDYRVEHDGDEIQQTKPYRPLSAWIRYCRRRDDPYGLGDSSASPGF